MEAQLPTVDGSFLKVRLGDTATGLDQELPSTSPGVLKPSSGTYQFLPFHIIQHDDISTSFNGLIGFCLGPNLDIDEQSEPADGSSCLNGIRNGTLHCIETVQSVDFGGARKVGTNVPHEAMWLSLSMIMLERS
jgi:hypothetical protein